MGNLNYEELEEENQKLRKQLKFYEEYDRLTGLYNKDTFYKKTKKKLKCSKNESFNIACVDIERFKLVNDLYGSDEGDYLLRYLAARMKTAFSKYTLILGRLSADIYAMCISGKITYETIEEKILDIFNEYPSDIKIVPAIGIYPAAEDDLPVELMCDRAILALNTVKGNYMKHLAVYDSSIRHELLEEHEILNRADMALQNGEFQVYMQPKCSMRTGKIIGAEALIRWIHPQRGLISPGAFIPVFEKNGFIKKLDSFIWEEVMKWLRGWIDKGRQVIPVSVNVSRIDIMGMDVFETINEIIKRYEIDPALFEVEVTESAYTNRPERLITTIEQLMRSGFTVLMDDFGSGYSSLNMLKDISIDILKLDMHFLDKENQKSRDILESVVHMAKWLNLRVIAEGVETKSQVDFLLNIGCEFAQGFYYYKPMPIPQFEALLMDDDKVDYSSALVVEPQKTGIINFKDLFHADVITDRLLNNILGGIALYQYDGETMHMIECNEEYYRVIYRGNIPKEEELADVISCTVEEDRCRLIEALEQAKETGDRGVELHIRRSLRDETVIWLQIRLFYLSTINGRGIYYAAISDVTGRMKMIEELKMSEQRFRVAMDSTSNTLFELDIPSRTARYAQHSREAFGLDACIANAPEGFIEQGSVCPGYEDVFREMYDKIYQGADTSNCTIRARMGDGEVVWNRITLTAIKDENGKSMKAVGLVENVTKEKRLEEDLERVRKERENKL